MSGRTAYGLNGPAAQQDQAGWFALNSSIAWPLPPCSMARASTDPAWYRSERLGSASAKGAVTRR